MEIMLSHLGVGVAYDALEGVQWFVPVLIGCLRRPAHRIQEGHRDHLGVNQRNLVDLH